MKIILTDPAVAIEVVQWCDDNFTPAGWEFRHNNLGTSKIEYVFEIPDTKDATLFSLKWADFV